MDNRLGGLIIVSAALLFLWLYDTGRWSGISTVIRGVPAGTLAPGNATADQGGPTITPAYPDWLKALLNTLGIPISAVGTSATTQTVQITGANQGAINVSNPSTDAAINAVGAATVGLPLGSIAKVGKNLWNNTIGSIIPIHF